MEIRAILTLIDEHKARTGLTDAALSRLISPSGSQDLIRNMRRAIDKGKLDYKPDTRTLEKMQQVIGAPAFLAPNLRLLPPPDAMSVPAAMSVPDEVNKVHMEIHGQTARLAATFDRKGLAMLRRKLDLIETLLAS